MGSARAEEALLRLADPGAGPQEAAERAEARRRVWDALKTLPPAQRAAVVGRYYLRMSVTEMAENVSSPPGTIKSRLHAARDRLSKLLRPEFRVDEEPPAWERAKPLGASPGFAGKEEGR